MSSATETTYTTLSTTEHYVTLTGTRGGEFGHLIGPAIATITITQHDGKPPHANAYRPTFTVSVGSRNMFGGFADHLRDGRADGGGMIWHAAPTNTTEHPCRAACRAYAPNVAQQDHADAQWAIACEWQNPIAQRADAAVRLLELVDLAGITPRRISTTLVRSECATVLATAWRRRNHAPHRNNGLTVGEAD